MMYQIQVVVRIVFEIRPRQLELQREFRECVLQRFGLLTTSPKYDINIKMFLAVLER